MTIGSLVLALCVAHCGTGAAFDKMHGAVPVPRLNYDSLFNEATPLGESPGGQTLIAGCVKRYGGEETLRELRSMRLTYRMKAFLNRDTLDVVKLFRRGRQYKISKSNPAIDETRILNGGESWYVGHDTMIVLDQGRYKAELFSYLTLTMPLGLKTERFDDIRFGTRDGDSLSYYYMEKRDTLMIVIGVDPHDSLIASSEGVIRQGDENFVFINRFADIRRVGGFWLPHELVNISMGLRVGESVLTNAEINVELRESLFRPPLIVSPQKVH